MSSEDRKKWEFQVVERLAKMEQSNSFILGDIKEIRDFLNDLSHSLKDELRLSDSRLDKLEQEHAKISLIGKIALIFITAAITFTVTFVLTTIF